MFVPMFMNGMSSSPQLNGSSTHFNNKEMVHSFQSIMQGITNKLQAVEVEQDIKSDAFHLQEDVEADLIDLFEKMSSIDSFTSDEQETIVHSLMTSLEQLLNRPDDELIESIHSINEALLEHGLIEEDGEWIEQTIVLLLEQINQFVELRQSNDLGRVDAPLKNQVDASFLNRQAHVLTKLLTFYLTGDPQMTHSMPSTNNQQLLENIQQLRQVLNEAETPKLTQFLNKLENHLKLSRNETYTSTNLQQVVQRVMNDTFQLRSDNSKPVNQLSLQNYQLHPTIHFGSTMTPVEQYTIFVNQSVNSTSSSQQKIIEQLQQIIQTSRFGKVGGSNQLTIQLKPAHLGEMMLRFVQEDNQLTVRMIVTTKAAKEMLEANLHQLRHLFSPGQVVIERQNIDQFQQQLSNYFDEPKEDEQSKQEDQPKKQKENKKDNEKSMTFQDYLFHEEV